jgi:hypothetical protein
MLYKGLRINTEIDTYYIIAIGNEFVSGLANKGTRIDTIHDVWVFENEIDRDNKLIELNENN